MAKRSILLLLVTGVVLTALVGTLAYWQIPNEPSFYYYVGQRGVETSLRRTSSGEALFMVKQHGLAGFIDCAGRLRIPPVYDRALPFSGGMAPVLLDGKWGFVDADGVLVIQPRFAQVGFFNEGLAPARSMSAKWGYVDSTGNWVIQPRFDVAGPFHDGVARVGVETLLSRLAGRFRDAGIACNYEYVDRTGRLVARPSQFVFAGPSAAVVHSAQSLPRPMRVGQLFGYANQRGEVVISPQFEFAYPFVDGLARVTVRDGSGYVLTGYIDRNGAYVWQPSR